MWDWIKSFHVPFYNTFLQTRAMQEYERIYKKSFSEELKDRNIISNHAILNFWKLETGGTSYHFGHLYGNVSTTVGNYKLHLDAFDTKYPSGKYLNDEKLAEELEFEKFTHSFCQLAEKYNFCVWEGTTRNLYSLCMSSFFPDIKKLIGISIKKKKKKYFICYCSESNPNNIPVSSFTIDVGNNHSEILSIIENKLKELIKINGNPYNRTPYYFVADPYWRNKNINYT